MATGHGAEIWKQKDGRAWRIGQGEEIAWIVQNTHIGLAITSAVPPLFEAYATLELPGTGNHAESAVAEDPDRHDSCVLTVLGEHTTAQPWWLGYLDTGAADVVFDIVPKVTVYAGGAYVLVEAGPAQAGSWRARDHNWKGVLPDLMFPVDRSWLVCTLWDDDWTCIGGTRQLIDSFLEHADLGHRVREVSLSDPDATPPGHTAI